MAQQKTYANTVKTLREKRVWSQEQLAAIAGVSARTVQRIEAGGACSQDTLKALAAAFEMDVAQVNPDLSKKQPQNASLPGNSFLMRIQSGAEVVNLADGAEAFGYTVDDLKSEVERKAVGLFLDLVKEWGDMWSDIEPSEQIRLTHECTALIKELEGLGLWVFGRRFLQPLHAGGGNINLQTLTIGIHKHNNPEILKASSLGDLFQQLTRDLETNNEGKIIQ